MVVVVVRLPGVVVKLGVVVVRLVDVPDRVQVHVPVCDDV